MYFFISAHPVNDARDWRTRPRGGLLRLVIEALPGPQDGRALTGGNYTAPVPLILFNKPYGVLSQFSRVDERPTLKDYVLDERVYPAGRLDVDSEGLMLLTDDGHLQARISQPRSKLPKSYWAQVEGLASRNHLDRLTHGVDLKDGKAVALCAHLINEPENLWPRNPPIRERRDKLTCWIDLTIHEGRNRQVRRMTAAAGLPTLRLVRHAIGPWRLGDLASGDTRGISNEKAWQCLDNYQTR
jgi:23S rRNA pseudouridine2457 synthase